MRQITNQIADVISWFLLLYPLSYPVFVIEAETIY